MYTCMIVCELCWNKYQNRDLLRPTTHSDSFIAVSIYPRVWRCTFDVYLCNKTGLKWQGHAEFESMSTYWEVSFYNTMLKLWQSSRPASFSPAGLTLWPSWLERWLATLSGLSVQVRIPVGLSGHYKTYILKSWTYWAYGTYRNCYIAVSVHSHMYIYYLC